MKNYEEYNHISIRYKNNDIKAFFIERFDIGIINMD